MRVLLDTHTLIWAQDEPTKLGPVALSILQSPANQLLVSLVTLWELSIKIAIGKLKLSPPYRPWIDKAIADLNLTILPITLDHAEQQIGLPFHHRDPFDRLLAAQALVESIPLASADAVFDAYGVTRLWN
ncbi:type II toxin-antitoxin system VapC family toxin [Limnoglobus roseus]|uniref:Twitching motility protein PilT n=1 Tax=Limnoglobus roseus TaxID=2598579 RepID=A0A5C1ASL2_9BACT|nr:type II toxin-antitoxin system VapC family toxin [Limnoglobus roseus]QEL21083.1 twitching motility protein PilT [Limnoglobus roseus]